MRRQRCATKINSSHSPLKKKGGAIEEIEVIVISSNEEDSAIGDHLFLPKLVEISSNEDPKLD